MYKNFTKNKGIPNEYTHKILLVMRLTTVLLIATIMQVSASGFAQRISLNERNASLEKVLKEIRKQSGYDIFFNGNILPKAKTINVVVTNVEIKEALNISLAGLGLDYKIEGKSITIVAKQDPDFLNRMINRFTTIDVEGKILGENDAPLQNASIRIKGSTTVFYTSINGSFLIKDIDENSVLIISYVGYKSVELPVRANMGMIRLVVEAGNLEEVAVVSTGYQVLPKERATGSFEKIDNKLFNRNVSTDVISRLEGLTSGLLFDKRTSRTASKDGLSIRGLSTLFSNSVPLIVVDNFPYDGDINNINPNDVENVTILKDAAAASIWGVRAGNGVIVITTKKGALDEALRVSVNSNLIIEDKPDLMKIPTISSAGYIEVEKMLYKNGVYDDDINNETSYPVLSPVVDLLIQNSDVARNKIEALKQYDVRKDFMKYVYRKPVRQQYSFNLSKGSKSLSYFISGGYDNDLDNIINNKHDRLSLRANTIFIPVKNLEIQTNIQYTLSNQHALGGNSNLSYGSMQPSDYQVLYPYTRLADDSGNPLIIPKDYRSSFIKDNSGVKILDWTYSPLAEVDDSYNLSKQQDLLLNLNANYKISSVFSADLKYQYEKTNSTSNNFQGLGSYYTRNLINRYTELNGDQIIRNIPLGGILDKSIGDFNSYNLRSQLNANKTWSEKHQLSAIAGIELKQNHSFGNNYRTYGYDPDLLIYQNVDFVNNYPIYKNLSYDTSIPNDASFLETINRYTSIYTNASYTFDNRFIASVSARKDASNLFGVNANQKGVPLWSTGLSWNISNEKFYKIDWLAYLKLRSTYGYNGNLRTDLSAYPIIRNMPSNRTTNLPYADVISPPNSDLRWEKVNIMNFGIDFGFKNNFISGSLEYYKKSAKDLIALTPIESTTGVTSVTRNTANLKAEGVDFTLNGDNKLGSVRWNSTFIYSYNQNKVVKYLQKYNTASGYIGSGSYSAINPIEGKPAYAIFAYKWAGLDPNTGDPQGYLDGKVSKDYVALRNAAINDLKYVGSAIPTSFGAFRNTFSMMGIAVSANIAYKLGYYFRRQGLSYDVLFESGLATSDFDNRWQKSGDELNTNVPSMIYPNNSYRDDFYTKSTALIEKGDHVRLQDINLSYTFNRFKWGLKDLRLFFSMNNVGIIWRANKLGIDPDYDSASYPASKTYSFGFNANF